MRKLMVFNSITLDGYFTDSNNDMSWAHQNADDEWNKFTSDNASGGGVLLFGRKTYELMASFWPTKQAYEMMPTVAEGMNNLPKVVFSRTMDQATWNNTTLFETDRLADIQQWMRGPDLRAEVKGGVLISTRRISAFLRVLRGLLLLHLVTAETQRTLRLREMSDRDTK